MIEYRFLKFLDIFKSLFEKINIDYPVMRKIIQVKLTLDSRRTSTVMLNSANENKKEKNSFLSSIPVYFIMGLFTMPIMFLTDNYMVSMSIILGIFMFLMMTSLISDFSSVLLDLRDKSIILTKPVNSRTLNMAKIIHIFTYVLIITLGISAPSLIVGLQRNGILFFILYLFIIILIDLFVIMLTALIYLFILRFFSGEKLKDIINYVQIGLTISITLGVQILVRVFDFTELFNFQINPTWWTYFLPPLWFSGLFEFFLRGSRESYVIIYSLLALVIPIMSIVLYIVFIPEFEDNLQKLNQSDNKTRDKSKFTRLIAKLVSRNKEERVFYKFSRNMLKNERKLKLNVYPNLGFALVFPFIMMISGGGLSNMEAIGNSKSYLTIYFMGISIPNIIRVLEYSESYKGSWIYEFFPVDYNNIYKASLKAMFVNLITPAFLLVSIGFLFVFKVKVVPDLLIAYLGMFLSIYLFFKGSQINLPFSKDFGIVSSRGGMGSFVMTMVIYGVLLGLHFLSSFIVMGKYIYIGLLLLANFVAWTYGFREKEVVN